MSLTFSVRVLTMPGSFPNSCVLVATFLGIFRSSIPAAPAASASLLIAAPSFGNPSTASFSSFIFSAIDGSSLTVSMMIGIRPLFSSSSERRASYTSLGFPKRASASIPKSISSSTSPSAIPSVFTFSLGDMLFTCFFISARPSFSALARFKASLPPIFRTSIFTLKRALLRFATCFFTSFLIVLSMSSAIEATLILEPLALSSSPSTPLTRVLNCSTSLSNVAEAFVNSLLPSRELTSTLFSSRM
mmetsp:Transcript_6273/g.10186  ORF Transcript_6273/g.10186 Transcript_6273/m.10186 type:complete len:246 (-) Transcript_6273:344-1081(-)